MAAEHSFLVALVLVFGASGWQAARAASSIRAGVSAGLLSWLVSTAIGLGSLWIITIGFLDVIRHNTVMLQAFAHSGARP